VLYQIRIVVRPETVLRWHRGLMAAHHARVSRPKRVGCFAAVVPVGAIASWPAAQDSCKGLYTSGQNARYVASNCEVITTCYSVSSRGYCN
jgi:hypothetical protein